jgi:lactate permease
MRYGASVVHVRFRPGIAPQNIATGVSVTKMKGQEGAIFARTFIHSIVLNLLLGALIAVQQYLIPWVIPEIGG